MELRKIALVQASFERLAPEAQRTAALFYARLFELDPAVKPLFRHDMQEQGIKFMDMLGLMVTNLDRPATIIGEVKALAVRHTGYGVKPEHYHLVGAALLWALGESLGPAYTPDVHAAWHEAFYLLAGLMKEASAQVAAVPPPPLPTD